MNLLKCTPIQFPGGERHVRLNVHELPEESDRFFLNINLKSSNDIMDMLLMTDAIRRVYNCLIDIHLICPYFPYARQDRVALPGEPLSAAVMAKLINSQNYASVEIWDAHSDVTLALIDRVIHNECHPQMFSAIENGKHKTLIAPDMGASKKIYKLARAIRLPFIQAEKKRNVDTGLITDTVIHNLSTSEGPYLIVDDICDGGRTFIELAKKIKEGKPENVIDLYVTHGIFSKGFEELKLHFRNIYCANPFFETEEVILV